MLICSTPLAVESCPQGGSSLQPYLSPEYQMEVSLSLSNTHNYFTFILYITSPLLFHPFLTLGVFNFAFLMRE